VYIRKERWRRRQAGSVRRRIVAIPIMVRYVKEAESPPRLRLRCMPLAAFVCRLSLLAVFFTTPSAAFLFVITQRYVV